MEKKQKQSLDLLPGKRFGVGLSNENLSFGADSAGKRRLPALSIKLAPKTIL